MVAKNMDLAAHGLVGSPCAPTYLFQSFGQVGNFSAPQFPNFKSRHNMYPTGLLGG